jgi:hypothetical protein
MKKLTRNKAEKKVQPKNAKAAVATQGAAKEQAQCCAKVSTIVVGCHD